MVLSTCKNGLCRSVTKQLNNQATTMIQPIDVQRFQTVIAAFLRGQSAPAGDILYLQSHPGFHRMLRDYICIDPPTREERGFFNWMLTTNMGMCLNDLK